MKKSLSLILAVLMALSVFSVLSVTASAEETGKTPNGIIRLEDMLAERGINDNPKYITIYQNDIDGNVEEYCEGIYYDKRSGTLSIDNIDSTEHAFKLYVSNLGDVNVNVLGTNTLAGIELSDSTLYFQNTGTLNVNPLWKWKNVEGVFIEEYFCNTALDCERGGIIVGPYVTMNLWREDKEGGKLACFKGVEAEQTTSELLTYFGHISEPLNWSVSEEGLTDRDLINTSLSFTPIGEYVAENEKIINVMDEFAAWGLNDDGDGAVIYDGFVLKKHKGISYDKKTNTLILDNVPYVKNAFLIQIRNMGKLNIELKGESGICGFRVENTDISFIGDGKLTLNPGFSYTIWGEEYKDDHIFGMPIQGTNSTVSVSNTVTIYFDGATDDEASIELTYDEPITLENAFHSDATPTKELRWLYEEIDNSYWSNDTASQSLFYTKFAAGKLLYLENDNSSDNYWLVSNRTGSSDSSYRISRLEQRDGKWYEPKNANDDNTFFWVMNGSQNLYYHYSDIIDPKYGTYRDYSETAPCEVEFKKYTDFSNLPETLFKDGFVEFFALEATDNNYQLYSKNDELYVLKMQIATAYWDYNENDEMVLKYDIGSRSKILDPVTPSAPTQKGYAYVLYKAVPDGDSFNLYFEKDPDIKAEDFSASQNSDGKWIADGKEYDNRYDAESALYYAFIAKGTKYLKDNGYEMCRTFNERPKNYRHTLNTSLFSLEPNETPTETFEPTTMAPVTNVTEATLATETKPEETEPNTTEPISTEPEETSAPITEPATVPPETDSPTNPEVTTSPVTEPVTDKPTDPIVTTQPQTEPETQAPTEAPTEAPVTEPKETKANIAKATVSGIKDKVYTGKAIKQNIKVKLDGKTLTEGVQYKLSYSDNKNAGNAKLTITGINSCEGKLIKTFTINKAKNTLKVSAVSKKVKAVQLRKKKCTVTGAIKIKKHQGAVSYAKITKKSSKLLTINKKGVITVKKTIVKKNTILKINVWVKADGNKNYKSAKKKILVKITVK